MRRWADAVALARGVERLLLPAECLLCREPIASVERDALICGLCRSRWEAIAPPICERCGDPLHLGLACRLCATWPDGFRSAQSAVWLDGSARRAVHHLKYDGWWRAAEAMADAMRTLAPLTGRPILIPIPLGARRRHRRGYNQSERLAAALAGRIGGRVREDLLARRRETPTQTALTPEERQANVAGAFVPSPGARRLALVLVDDVFTTGATLSEAATALLRAGAVEVHAVTFARARQTVG
jgi:ComF family protein